MPNRAHRRKSKQAESPELMQPDDALIDNVASGPVIDLTATGDPAQLAAQQGQVNSEPANPSQKRNAAKQASQQQQLQQQPAGGNPGNKMLSKASAEPSPAASRQPSYTSAADDQHSQAGDDDVEDRSSPSQQAVTSPLTVVAAPVAAQAAGVSRDHLKDLAQRAKQRASKVKGVAFSPQPELVSSIPPTQPLAAQGVLTTGLLHESWVDRVLKAGVLAGLLLLTVSGLATLVDALRETSASLHHTVHSRPPGTAFPLHS